MKILILLTLVSNHRALYHSITLHDPHMSTCETIVLGGKGNGFEAQDWRAPYFNPTSDNVFMLIGCSPKSPIFQDVTEMMKRRQTEIGDEICYDRKGDGEFEMESHDPNTVEIQQTNSRISD
ncbi:unnamed protein product [Microthlaspi erraticum]|uniref:Uncharacterized protein n=1 Tax=Microthlaspi erraticum TaxID=1685480 RepID=A0A6D2HR26_9BRAS|nr:unnamed protein product [Microthlaspi erraticum]